jgi:hypothetical protein
VNLRLAPVLAVLLSVAGCAGDAVPTSPTTSSSATATSQLSPAGIWSGSINDAISGDGTMRLALSEQSANVFAGTWSATFKNGDGFSGPAAAGLFAPTGFGVMLYVEPQPACTSPAGPAPLGFTLINVVVTSSRLTAVAGRTSCNGPSFGTVSLSAQ